MALTDNLVSYWAMDEASGTRGDSHASNDLLDGNTVASAAGIINNGADFEKDNNEYLYITNASQSGLNFTTALSISAWVKPESLSSNMSIVSKWASGSLGFLFFIRGASNILELRTDAGGGNAEAYASYTFSTATWYHVVVTFNAGTVALYVNGTALTMTDSTCPSPIQSTTADFRIGGNQNNPSGEDFDGIIDEVGIWNKVLSTTEITQLYNGGAGLAYPFNTTGIKTWSNVSRADVKTLNGVASASIKTINGIT